MDIPTIEEIESACDGCEGVNWYGLYNGRFYFQGYAVVCDSSADLAELINAIASMGLQLPRPDHQDNMGLNMLFAWDKSTWAERKPLSSYTFRTLAG